MNRDKKTIRRSFSRAADTYDGGSEFQREVAVDLARCFRALTVDEKLQYPVYERAGLERMLAGVRLSARTEKALEVGCGTGHFTEELKKVCPSSRVYASDISHRMLTKAGGKFEELLLAASDCESLAFASSSFDLVASSLTYQWADDLAAAFTEAARVLKPGGLFIFSTLGPATLNELRASYRDACADAVSPALMEFKGTDEVSGALAGAGLSLISLESLPVFKRYGDLFSLLRTLRAIGASPPAGRGGGLSAGAVLKKAAEVYRRRFPAPGGDGIIATYEVIFVAAQKDLLR